MLKLKFLVALVSAAVVLPATAAPTPRARFVSPISVQTTVVNGRTVVVTPPPPATPVVLRPVPCISRSANACR